MITVKLKCQDVKKLNLWRYKKQPEIFGGYN